MTSAPLCAASLLVAAVVVAVAGERSDLAMAQQAAEDTPSEDTTPGDDDLASVIEPDTPDAATTPLPAERFHLRYVAGLKQALSYNAPAFSYKARTDASIPSWQAAQRVDRSSFGLAVAYERALTPTWTLAPHAYYFLNDDVTSNASFDSAAPQSQVRTRTKGHTVGTTVEAQAIAWGADCWALIGAGGFGLFSSAVTVDASLYDAVGAVTYKIASYESYLYALTADAGASMQWRPYSGLLLSAELLAFVPLTTLAHGDSGSIDFSSADFGAADYRLRAMSNGVDHRASGLGYALAFGAGWAF